MLHNMQDLIPTPHLTSPLYKTHISQVKLLNKFFNYQREDGQRKGPKYVVDPYVINYTYLYQHIVVLDKYTHSNLINKYDSFSYPC